MKINKEEFKRIYENNRRLDSIFNEKYSEEDSRLFEKNAIELLVELGEFVNETKCFKYWSIKKPNMDDMLEEYADCITMTLYFFNELNMDIDDTYNHIGEDDILNVINTLYMDSTKILNNCNKELMNIIFGNLLYLGTLLNLKEQDIIEAIDKKHKTIEERLNSDY